MQNKIRYLPSAIGLALSIWAFLAAFSPSGSPQIFMFSYFRFAIIVAVSLFVLYLSVSFWFPRLISFNNWVAYTIIGAAIVVEIGLRSMSTVLPTTLVSYLPRDARTQITTNRDVMNERTLNGDGLLYFFKPNYSFSTKPWVKIDSNGYRNKVAVKDAVDVVFLGDSVTIAEAAHKDFADHFREQGISAFNLAIGGYGPFQYRDAYKKFVIEPGLRHRFLIVVVAGRNDFENALSYARILAKGGDYQAYLGKRTDILFRNINSAYFPWVASILVNTMPMIKSVISGRRSPSAKGTVRLPYGDLAATANILRVDAVKEGDLTLLHFKKAMNEILAIARDNGVKTLVAYHPPSRVIYGPLLDGHEDFKKTLAKNHRNLMTILDSFLDRPGVRFIDLSAFEHTAAARESIGATPMNVHLNTRGIELVAGELFKELQQLKN
ncbi:MAG: hypothetical protein HN377_03605 [Alphaproteobacteria bacterium]|jgi:hypothetical protein|nr:hypothetical protein [Alphaproteobacteria bacterium]MBT7942776.1 hypothetical protein [Alphaproteobacteria bacterium]